MQDFHLIFLAKKIKTQMKNRLIYIFALIFIFSSESFAYVLETPKILELMIDRYGVAKRLLVIQKHIFYGGYNYLGKVELDETLRYEFPTKFRSDISSQSMDKSIIISSGRLLTIVDEKVIEQPESVFDRYKDIILYRSNKGLQAHLEKLGIDISVSSLDRFEGRICFVIGVKSYDESVSYLLIDKQTFMPLRMFIGGSAFVDIRYTQWQQFKTIWYPTEIKIYQDEVLTRRIVVDEIFVDSEFHESYFDIDSIVRIYKSVQSYYKSEDISEIQKAINDFRRKFEE